MAAKQPDMALGFEDEVWWSHEAPCQRHAWSEDKPVRLVEKTVPAKGPEGKAVACYGLYVLMGSLYKRGQIVRDTACLI
jgi:hypothetical protein